MFISRARRFIFVHIPKTGGTAMTLALEARAKADDVIIGDTPKAILRKGRLQGVQAAGRLWKHSTLADIAGLLSDEEVAGFFTFTIIRNPWDRAVSYYHWLREQGFDHPAVALAKAHDFSAFLNHPHTQASLRQWPYAAYMRDAGGVERASTYLRLESLAQDLPQLESHLGFRVDIPVANTSTRARDWRGYYSADDAALLAQLCAEDIARFDYRFDPDHG